MRTKSLAVLISIVGSAGFLGCSTEADYRGEANEPAHDTVPSAADGVDTDPIVTDRSAEAGAAMSDAASLGAYEEWDTDNSGDVSKTEWNSRFVSLPAWSEWDANGDQSLDESEAKSVSWFEDASWGEMDPDGDGKLARNEAGDALWREWDANDDNKIEKSEWPPATA
jgi:hypothetical protein